MRRLLFFTISSFLSFAAAANPDTEVVVGAKADKITGSDMNCVYDIGTVKNFSDLPNIFVEKTVTMAGGKTQTMWTRDSNGVYLGDACQSPIMAFKQTKTGVEIQELCSTSSDCPDRKYKLAGGKFKVAATVKSSHF